MLEAMAYAGAFDSFSGLHRAQFFHSDKDGKTFIEKLINYGTNAQSAVSQNQFSIFDTAPEMDEQALPEIPSCEPWHPIQQLKYEKEIAGFYISGHPLDSYKPLITNYTTTDLKRLSDSNQQTALTNRMLAFVAIVTEVKKGITKNGKDYGSIQLEDYNDSYSWMLFGENFTKYSHLFEEGKQLFIKARLEERFRGKDYEGAKSYDLKPVDIFYLNEGYDKLCKSVMLTFSIENLTANTAYLIKEAAEKSPGNTPLIIRVVTLEGNFHSDFHNYKIKVNPEVFLKELTLIEEYKLELA